jgi:WD40 repeat protein
MRQLGCSVCLAAAWVLLARGQPPNARPPALPPINPAAARLSQTLDGLDGPGIGIVYDDRNGILVAGCEKGTLHCWEKHVTLGVRAGGKTPYVLQVPRPPLTALAGGPILATAGTDRSVHLWSLPDGQSLPPWPQPAPVRALSLSPDGKRLAAAGEDAAVRLWDLVGGKPIGQLTGHADWVLALAWSPDGKVLASGGYDAFVRLWDVASGKKLRDLPTQPPSPPNTPPATKNTVLALAFTPDGKHLAVGGTDAQIHLVNTADGKVGRSLSGHDGSVTALAFHPGGMLLVSASKDRTLRLWNPVNGQPIKSLEGHTSWVQGVVFVAQGTRLASVGADHTVRLWDLRP